MARSGDVILDSLFNNAMIEELIPSRIPKTRIGILFSVLAAEIEGWETVLDNFRDESFLSTAKLAQNVIKLSEPYYSQILARPSDVVLKFSWEDDVTEKTNITIPFGQIVETEEADPIQFATIERAILYDNSTAVFVRARSVESGAHTMVDADEIRVINDSPGSGIQVENSEPSWGGRDDENLNSMRNNALAARYSMKDGTEDSLRIALANLGLESYQYNIVDNAFSFGSVAIYIDTPVNEQILEIIRALKYVKAGGIYLLCEAAVEIDLDLNFTIKIVNEHDITPEERDNLKKDLRAEVENYITLNGVGKKIVTSRLIHHIYQTLLDKYSMFEIELTNELLDTNLLDSNNNIIINSDQVAKINSLIVNITTA